MRGQRESDDLRPAILERASRDAEFRRRLLIDPKAVIYDTFGITVPDDIRLKFIEKSPDLDALIVLPDFIDNQELSDEELRQVAGGSNTEASWEDPDDP